MHSLPFFCILLLILSSGSSVGIKDAIRLIENTPDYISAAARKRCPRVEILWADDIEYGFQIRSRCTEASSGFIGNYVVDRQNAEVWEGLDRVNLVTSKRLKNLQKELLMKLRRDRNRTSEH